MPGASLVPRWTQQVAGRSSLQPSWAWSLSVSHGTPGFLSPHHGASFIRSFQCQSLEHDLEGFILIVSSQIP